MKSVHYKDTVITQLVFMKHFNPASNCMFTVNNRNAEQDVEYVQS